MSAADSMKLTPTLEAILKGIDYTSLGSGIPNLQSLGLTGSSIFALDEASRTKHKELQDEIVRLRQKLEAESSALQQEKSNSRASEEQFAQLEQTFSDLQKKERFGSLLNCVNKNGSRFLLESEEFRDLFLAKRTCNSFVMSIDIRRSTELMLKARSADAFASFTTELCSELMEIIKDSYGVIDKFTGDGVLGYFPEFFSGPDAAYEVVLAAQQCHAAFTKHYESNRKSFKTIYTNVGLGIGIDYGEVQLVQIAGALNAVGEPVVYACRLSAAPAGSTLMNELAYEVLMNSFGKHFFIEEISQEIKHEGPMLAYAVKFNNRFSIEPRKPDWVNQIGGSQVETR